MIGTIIGGAIGAASSIFGGIKAAKEMNKVKQDLEAQRDENRAWYLRGMGEDATQRADAQRALALTQERIRQMWQGAEGRGAVMGMTNEAVAAQKAQGAQALADATADIAVKGDARKDAIEARFQSRDDAMRGQLQQTGVAKANAISQAAAGVADAAGNLGLSYDMMNEEKKQGL